MGNYFTCNSYCRIKYYSRSTIKKGEIILSITITNFNSLIDFVNSVMDNILILTYLESGIKAGYQGRFSDLIKMVDERLKSETKQNLNNEYATNLANSTVILTNKVVKLLSDL